jgi:hypothetical protein
MNPEMNYASQPADAAPEAASQNFFKHLIGVVFSPGEAFPKIGRESSVFTALVIPMLLLAIVSGVTSLLPAYRIGDEEVARKQIEPAVRAGWIPEDAAEKQIAQASDPATATARKIWTGGWAGVVMVVITLVVAGVFKLFAMLMGKEVRFGPLLSVVSYAYLAIGLIQLPVVAASLYLQDREAIDLFNPVMSNLGAVLSLIAPGMNKFVTALASWIDLFGIWRIILLAIGCAAVTLKMKSSTASIPHIILYGLMALIFSALSGMMR